MRIVHVASEMFPFVKTGGLADVVGALTPALATRGHEVEVFLPGYRAVLEAPALANAERGRSFKVVLGDRELAGEVRSLTLQPGLTLHLIVRDEFFDRRHLYWNGERDYDDNDVRFLFFQKAVIEILRAEERFVDVVHCHDWQTGLLPLLLRHAEQRAGIQLAERTVFTVHNIIYQGIFPRRTFALTNLHESLNSMDGIEYYGQISTLKAGLMYADRVTTVSPNYAREIQTAEHGFGLEGVVRLRAAALRGIRNGIDAHIWNPATDEHLPVLFSWSKLAGKKTCRATLLKQLNWPLTYTGPLFAIISRMTQAKGHDVLLEAADFFLQHNCRLVVLGSGEAKFESAWRELAAKHPDNFAVSVRLDEPMSHLVMAGADFFLMPSHTEPCGLTQMYAQTYGTIPLAGRVGGLVDTVRDLKTDPEHGTGYLFEPTVAGLVGAMAESLALFAKPNELTALQQRAMKQDFSWESVVGHYEQLYNE